MTTPRGISNRRSLRSDDNLLDQYTLEIQRWEEEQRPRYEEAYRMMRELIPLDIYKSSVQRLFDSGLPGPTAQRIWQTKILWLICTHQEDIAKVLAILSLI